MAEWGGSSLRPGRVPVLPNEVSHLWPRGVEGTRVRLLQLLRLTWRGKSLLVHVWRLMGSADRRGLRGCSHDQAAGGAAPAPALQPGLCARSPQRSATFSGFHVGGHSEDLGLASVSWRDMLARVLRCAAVWGRLPRVLAR